MCDKNRERIIFYLICLLVLLCALMPFIGCTTQERCTNEKIFVNVPVPATPVCISAPEAVEKPEKTGEETSKELLIMIKDYLVDLEEFYESAMRKFAAPSSSCKQPSAPPDGQP